MPAASKRRRKGVLVIPDPLVMPYARLFPGLFDPAATRALFALRALAQRIDDDYNAWLAPYGLTATKLNYLAVLYATPDNALPLSELSQYIHASNANVTVIITALERSGLVKRKVNPNDRRSFMAVLQPKGRALIERVFPVHHANIKAALKHVTQAERASLLEILTKIGDAFDEFSTSARRKG